MPQKSELDRIRKAEELIRIAQIEADLAKESQGGLLSELGAVAGGFGRGVATGAGAPVDLPNMLLGLGGVTQGEPVAGDFLRNSASRLTGITPPSPQTMLGRVGTRVAEEVGAGVGGALSLSYPIGKAGQGVKLLRKLGEMSLPKLMMLEAGAGVVPGAAAGVTREVIDSDVAELGAQLTATFGPGGLRSLINFARHKITSRLPPITEAQMKERAGRLLNETISAAGKEKLDKYLSTKDDLPQGFQPTLGQIVGEPTILRMEKGVLQRSGAIQQAIEQNTTNTELLKQHLAEQLSLPKNVSPERVQQAFAHRLDALNMELQTSMAQVNDDIQSLQQAAMLRDPQVEGKRLRARLLNERQNFRKKAQMIYAAVDPDGVLQIDTSSIGNKAEELISEAALLEDKANIPRVLHEISTKYVDKNTVGGIYRKTTTTSKQVPLNEITILRSRLLKEIAAERALGVQNNPKLRRLEIIFEETDNLVTQRATTPAVNPAETSALERLSTANAFYRQGMETFNQGVVADVLQRSPRRDFRMPDSEVARAFLRSNERLGAKERADAFRKVFKHGDEAEEAVYNTALHDIYRAASRESVDLRTGEITSTVNPKSLLDWLNKHDTALSQFPETKKRLRNVTETNAKMAAMRQQVFVSQDELRKNAANLFLDEHVDIAARRILNSPKSNQEIQDVLKIAEHNDDAKQGIRSAFYEAIMERIENSKAPTWGLFLDPGKFKEMLKGYKAELTTLYGTDGYARFEKMQKVAEWLVNPVPAQGLRPTEVRLVTGTVLAEAAQRAAMMSPLTPKGMLKRITFKGLRTFFSNLEQDDAQNLLAETLLNPEVSKTMMMRADEAQGPIALRRLRAHLSNIGGRSGRENRGH